MILKDIEALKNSHQVALDQCVKELKEIKGCLNDIQDKLESQKADSTALQIETERLKNNLESILNRVTHLEKIFDSMFIKGVINERNPETLN